MISVVLFQQGQKSGTCVPNLTLLVWILQDRILKPRYADEDVIEALHFSVLKMF